LLPDAIIEGNEQVPQSRRKEVLHEKLRELNLPETFHVPIDPTFVAKGIFKSWILNPKTLNPKPQHPNAPNIPNTPNTPNTRTPLNTQRTPSLQYPSRSSQTPIPTSLISPLHIPHFHTSSSSNIPNTLNLRTFAPLSLEDLVQRFEYKIGLKIEKCKTMDSAKAPLWLVFENADRHGENITVLFKAGDDLRQDILTLQMLNIMDHLWKQVLSFPSLSFPL
jgi:hypothetical protein